MSPLLKKWWGHRKHKVHANAPQSLQELKNGIPVIIEDMLPQICELVMKWIWYCYRTRSWYRLSLLIVCLHATSMNHFRPYITFYTPFHSIIIMFLLFMKWYQTEISPIILVESISRSVSPRAQMFIIVKEPNFIPTRSHCLRFRPRLHELSGFSSF